MSTSNSSLTLRKVEERLPAGFRFHPRDEELVCDYLLKWLLRFHHPHQTPDLLIQVDLNTCEPWDLPESALVGGKEWYFYSQRDRKYSTGTRTNRATISGYWKATGKDRPIFRQASRQLVGMRKTLVFYQGRAPRGRKTDWVMHEFRLDGPLSGSTLRAPEDWVLCRVSYKKTTSESAAGGFTEVAIGSITNQHMPCFSIFRPNQLTNPTFVDHSSNFSSGPERLAMSSFGGALPAELGIYYNNWNPSSSNSSNNSCCDEKEMMRAAGKNHLPIASKLHSDNDGFEDYNMAVAMDYW